MQLTAIFLLSAALTVSAKTISQTVTYSGTNVPVETVFQEIKKQTGYLFVFNDRLISQAKPVTVNAVNEPLDHFLQQITAGQPFDFAIEASTVYIKKKVTTPTIIDKIEVNEAPPITGRVTNADGQPLEGASVRIKGTKKGTSTNSKGEFTVDADDNATLIISIIGYESREIKASVGIIILERSSSVLDETQIIAYGKTSRRLTTANIGSVKAADIEKQPVSNPLLALQGRVPGLQVIQSTGTPGGTVKVNIQGVNSLLGGVEPYYVIDGNPYISSMGALSGNSPVWGSGSYDGGGFVGSLSPISSGSPLNYINPADIESIEVLKDAAATAIYGSRGANGVILITTKKGKAGRMSTEVNIKSGFDKVTQRVDLLNASQYLAMRREALKNDNLAVSPTDYDLNGTWDTTKTTDWQDYVYGKSARYDDAQLSFSGGTGNTTYRAGLGYHRQGSVYPVGDFNDKKLSTSFSLASSSANQRFKMQFGFNYLYDNNLLPTLDLTETVLFLPPVAPALFNEDGSLNYAPDASGVSSWPGESLSGNPLGNLYNDFNSKVNNLISNAALSYAILEGLTVKANLGYNYMHIDEFSTGGRLESVQPLFRPYVSRYAIFGNHNLSGFNIEPQLIYHRRVNAHRFELLVGTTILQNTTRNQSLSASGQASDAQLKNIGAATSFVSSADFQEYKYNALFATLNYNYQDRYIIDFSARRDGSSRFGPETRFHNFGSLAGAWIFSKENWIPLPDFLSFGKFKASYGTTGNDKIGNYSYMDLFGNYPAGIAYQGVAAINPSRLTNPYLQWEETKKLNIGLDLGFLKDRILVGANFGKNRSSNLLQNLSLPSATGFLNVLENFRGTVENTSLEFTLSSEIIKSRNFSWTVNTNLTIPKNELIALPDVNKLQTASLYIIGEPLGIQRAFHFLGVDPQTGKYLVEDAQGNATANPSLDYLDNPDKKALINTNPRYYGGLQSSFSYGGLSVDVSFQFSKQLSTRYLYPSGQFEPGRSLYNQTTSVLDRWQQPGDQVSLQSYTTLPRLNIMNGSDAYYEDGSYVRFKTLAVSWKLPSQWINKIKLPNVRIGAQAQNLFTWSKYSGLDPEAGNFLPPYRTIIFNLMINF